MALFPRIRKKIQAKRASQPYRVPKARLLLNATRFYNQMDFEKLKSRKLWATVIGGLIVTLGTAIGVSPEVAQNLAAMVAAYVVGQGIADHGAKGGSQGEEGS